MQSIQTCFSFDLSKVKPLEEVSRYRAYCLQSIREACSERTVCRERSLIDQTQLVPWERIDGLDYSLCPNTESLFLTKLPLQSNWDTLLDKVNQYRHVHLFKEELKKSRLTHVYEPKRAWIEDTLQWHRLENCKVLEVTIRPSEFTSLLKESPHVGEVLVWGEAQSQGGKPVAKGIDVAILLESLDKAWDPVVLLQKVLQNLRSGGLLFLTALVASGFDMKVLGSKNLYLCPPDRANCFSLKGLTQLLTKTGFSLVEVSTPGILDVEIVRAHRLHDPSIRLSAFEETLLGGDAEKLSALQIFLQQSKLSSFARIVARKQ